MMAEKFSRNYITSILRIQRRSMNPMKNILIKEIPQSMVVKFQNTKGVSKVNQNIFTYRSSESSATIMEARWQWSYIWLFSTKLIPVLMQHLQKFVIITEVWLASYLSCASIFLLFGTETIYLIRLLWWLCVLNV